MAVRDDLATTTLTALTAAGIMLAVLSGFSGYLPWQIGTWPEVELSIVVIHAAAALCSFSLATLYVLQPKRICQSLISAPVLVSAGISFVIFTCAPFAEFPFLSLAGSAQTGEGAILWLDIAVFIAASNFCRPVAGARLAICLGVAATAFLLPLLALLPETRILWFHDYLAFAGIGAAIVVAVYSGPSDAKLSYRRLAAGVAVALPALVVSKNLAVGLALCGLFVPAFAIGEWGLRRFAGVRIKWVRAGYVTALIAIVCAVPLLTAELSKRNAVASLVSRDRIVDVLRAPFVQNPALLLTGYGWGHTEKVFGDSLAASTVKIWDEQWDAPLRDIFHSHNIFLEALFNGGVFNLAALLLFIALPIFLAPRDKLPLAAAFTLAFAALASLWFQLALTVPLTAIAFSIFSSSGHEGRQRPGLPFFLAFAGIAQLVTASVLLSTNISVAKAEIYAGKFEPVTGKYVNCDNFPDESWRGDIASAHLLARHLRHFKQTDGRELSPEFNRVAYFYCLSNERGLEEKSAILLRGSLILRSEIAFNPRFASFARYYPPSGESWHQITSVYLKESPNRTDIVIPYLAWLLQKKDYLRLQRVVDQILMNNTDDPAGLWFQGLLFLTDSRQLSVTKGKNFLKKGKEMGIEKWLPIPENIKALIKE